MLFFAVQPLPPLSPHTTIICLTNTQDNGRELQAEIEWTAPNSGDVSHYLLNVYVNNTRVTDQVVDGSGTLGSFRLTQEINSNFIVITVEIYTVNLCNLTSATSENVTLVVPESQVQSTSCTCNSKFLPVIMLKLQCMCYQSEQSSVCFADYVYMYMHVHSGGCLVFCVYNDIIS